MRRHLAIPAALVAWTLAVGGCGPGEAPPPAGDGPGDGPGEGPVVVAPWVRAAPPTATVMAGYLRLEAGAQAVTVAGAECAGFARTELHETRVVDGVATMRQLDGLDLAPGASRVLEPGGMHLMLMGPERIPPAGESVRCALLLADGERLGFEATVRPGADDDDHAHHGH